MRYRALVALALSVRYAGRYLSDGTLPPLAAAEREGFQFRVGASLRRCRWNVGFPERELRARNRSGVPLG